MSTLSTILMHRITFMENTSKSELEEENWKPRFTAFAQVKPLYDNKFGSIEKFTFGHLVTEAYFMIKIRFTEKVNSKMRVLFEDRMFEIKRIINVGEKNRIMQLITLEIS